MLARIRKANEHHKEAINYAFLRSLALPTFKGLLNTHLGKPSNEHKRTEAKNGIQWIIVATGITSEYVSTRVWINSTLGWATKFHRFWDFIYIWWFHKFCYFLLSISNEIGIILSNCQNRDIS